MLRSSRKQRGRQGKMQVKVKEVVKFGGNSQSKNGSVNINFDAGYGELVESVKVLQMLNADVTIKAKLPGEKAMMLGMFRVHHVDFAGDGASRLKFNGLRDFVEFNNINKLPLSTDEISEFQVLMVADIEEEDEDEEGLDDA